MEIAVNSLFKVNPEPKLSVFIKIGNAEEMVSKADHK